VRTSDPGWSRAAQDAAEARYVPYSSQESPAGKTRPRWLVAPSLVSILIAGGSAFVVAVWTTGGALFCTVTKRLSAPDIPLAFHVVIVGCAVGFLLSILCGPRLLVLPLLLTACALLTGIVLVARDSATWRASESCGIASTDTETVTNHLWGLYLFWGIPLIVLLLQAVRCVRKQSPDGPRGLVRGSGEL
jgi:hypothetical protein